LHEQHAGDVLVVLSAAPDDGGELSYSSYWRARYAIRAWQNENFKTVVVSGGGPATLELMAASGIHKDAIVYEMRSTSTRENVIETAQILAGLAGTKVPLTSDFHMYRSLGVFSKLGMRVLPMPVPDAMKRASTWPGRYPAVQGMVVETLKTCYYYWKGSI
jgi:uncharacterized SAM-binding protein YcdF (DUF218 family)